MRVRRPEGKTTFHIYRSEQDTRVLDEDGCCAFYLTRPLKAGRLDDKWNYKLYIGDSAQSSDALITIVRKNSKAGARYSTAMDLLGRSGQIVTSLHWLGANRKSTGTRKYLFDWGGREYLWNSHTTLTGCDHSCIDAGSGEVVCYLRGTFFPLIKDGKLEISSKVTDETTRTVLLGSCMAYKEWADRRETGVYLK